MTIDYPPGWQVGLLGSEQQLVIGSYLLPAESANSWWFDRARAALPEDGALVLIFDYGALLNDPRYRRLFPPRPRSYNSTTRRMASTKFSGLATC